MSLAALKMKIDMENRPLRLNEYMFRTAPAPKGKYLIPTNLLRKFVLHKDFRYCCMRVEEQNNGDETLLGYVEFYHWVSQRELEKLVPAIFTMREYTRDTMRRYILDVEQPMFMRRVTEIYEEGNWIVHKTRGPKARR